MTQRIFKSMLSVAGVTLMICFLLIVGILYQHFDDEMMIQLEKEAGYLSAAVESRGIDYLKSLNDDQRITLIDAHGNVLYDNQVDEMQMENHLAREEIKEAIETGKGASERYSTTLSSKTIYYALRLNDGTILRVASYQNTVFYLLFGLIQPIGIIVIIMLCLAAYMSNRVAKKITEPINELDLDHPEENTTYPELNPLLTRIFRQKVKLKEQMEQATRQQTEFKMITDHMDEGFVIVAKDLSILSYNESIKKHLGLIDEIQGASIYILNHEKAFIDFIEKTMEGHHNEWLQNVQEHYYQWISNPVIQDNKVSGAVIVMMDVTEKTKRENYRREFTANVSHELKTPLTSISGFAEIIQNGIAREEDIQNFAGDIFKESQRLIQLVNDIIRLSQLDDESIVYQKEKVSIEEQVDKCLEPLLHSASKAKVLINKVGEDFTFNTVPSIFQEILFNLVDNAIKYNKENGHVDIIYNKDSQKVRITVLDNGIGIPPQDQERIFERFYRVDKGRSSQKGGTGLGLSIVKHGVATLNGRIELKSALHQGTTVTFDLPL